MARKSDKPAKQKPEDGSRPETGRKKDLLGQVRDAHKRMVDAPHEHSNREQALSDMRFLHIPGEQWDANQKKRRGKRPCYEFNKLAVTVKRVINDMRANRAQGKVRPFEDSDKETADVFEGLIRNICNASNFESIQDYAAGYQVGGGMGAWRIETEYSDDTTFEQEIRLSRIKNPFCLYLTDDEAIYVDRIPNTEYERRWPRASRTDFEESEFNDGTDDWSDENTVRVCEYWYKKPVVREMLLLSDGKTIDAEQLKEQPPPEGVTVVRSRQVRSFKVCMCIASGSAVLEEGEWPGKFIPFVQVFGEWVVIEGRVYWYGLTRNAKDAQRSYNVSRTSVTEAIASAPLRTRWATPAQAKGHEGKWAIAHEENLPYQLYTPDPATGGAPPVEAGGAQVPVALIQETQIASEEIKAVTGIFDQSLGSGPTSQSGIAIRQRQQQGELATYNFKANMAEGVRKTWEILVDLVPKIYTNERSIRILGADGAEKYVKINGVRTDGSTLEALPINDLSRGRFDVAITVGPSFSTQRQEFAEQFVGAAQANPNIWGLAGDLFFKAQDHPYAEQIAERMRLMLPPQIQQQLAQGKPVPPEVQAMMAQAQAAMQQAQQEIETEKAEAEKAKAEVQTAIANLKTEKAQLDAYIAKQLAQLQQRQFQQATAEVQGQRDQVYQEIAAAAQQFLAQAQEALAQVQGEQQRLSGSVDQAIAALMQPLGGGPTELPVQVQ
jgi:F0F1-type ATP synthase membrane subunit b/b'